MNKTKTLKSKENKKVINNMNETKPLEAKENKKLIKRNFSESELMELYRVSLKNVESQEKIASAMESFGYDKTNIDKGRQLANAISLSYVKKQQKTTEVIKAYNNFRAKYKIQSEIYSLHRKRAKFIFKEEPHILNRLSIKNKMPKSYTKWIKCVKMFYSEIVSEDIVAKSRYGLKFNAEELEASNNLILDIEQSRSEYISRRGESQNITKEKNKCLKKLNDWMSEFYKIARIALKDNIQLMEALGKKVKS